MHYKVRRYIASCIEICSIQCACCNEPSQSVKGAPNNEHHDREMWGNNERRLEDTLTEIPTWFRESRFPETFISETNIQRLRHTVGDSYYNFNVHKHREKIHF